MPGDIESARINGRNGEEHGSLFGLDAVSGETARPRDVCERMGLNWLAARQLYEAGFLSFDPEAVDRMSRSQEAELVFVGSLVVAGCDGAMLTYILRDLEKPYAYRMDGVYYDWGSRAWELLPRYEHFRDLFQEWLEDLVDSGQMRKLQELKERLERAIRNLHRMSPW